MRNAGRSSPNGTAAKDPVEHRSLVQFTLWSSLAHGGVMLAQALSDGQLVASDGTRRRIARRAMILTGGGPHLAVTIRPLPAQRQGPDRAIICLVGQPRALAGFAQSIPESYQRWSPDGQRLAVVSRALVSPVDGTTSSTATAVTTATTAASTSTSGNTSVAAKIVVPNVVGKDLQFAQDTMQAAGLYHLTSHDSTGQARAQVLDRNWQVTDQTPPAGSTVAADQLIDLGARKVTD